MSGIIRSIALVDKARRLKDKINIGKESKLLILTRNFLNCLMNYPF